MLKSFAKFVIVVAVVVPVLAACGSQSQRRPISNLPYSVDKSKGTSQTALSGNSGVQIYGTVNAGYGHSRTKTRVRHADGTTSTYRSSRTGGHSW